MKSTQINVTIPAADVGVLRDFTSHCRLNDISRSAMLVLLMKNTIGSEVQDIEPAEKPEPLELPTWME